MFVASSDWEELARLCHRVFIFREGRVVAELRGNLTIAAIAGVVFAGDVNCLDTVEAGLGG